MRFFEIAEKIIVVCVTLWVLIITAGLLVAIFGALIH